MKSEHRHELKTNELERIASDWGHASERYVHEHTNLLIAAAVVRSWCSSSASSIGGCRPAPYDARVGARLSDAQSTADYGTVADKYAGTKVAPWARLREGENELSSGIRLLFTDRDAGRSDVKKAEENFEKLINDKSSPDEIVDRALFGLARCRESMPPKDTGAGTINNPAIEVYERLLKFPTPSTSSWSRNGSPPFAPRRLRTLTPGSRCRIRNRPIARCPRISAFRRCPKTSVRPANRAARQPRRRRNPRNRPPRARVRPRRRQVEQVERVPHRPLRSRIPSRRVAPPSRRRP